jgi:antitoxin Phd
VARLVDETGAALVMKNDTPRYVILEWTQLNEDSAASSGEVFAVARRIIKDHLSAFKELAK